MFRIPTVPFVDTFPIKSSREWKYYDSMDNTTVVDLLFVSILHRSAPMKYFAHS